MRSPDAFGASNVAEIEGLNQRGGRTLSFCDLVRAGTVSSEMAGELAALVMAGEAGHGARRLLDTEAAGAPRSGGPHASASEHGEAEDSLRGRAAASPRKSGATILTAARPGGAGKSTVLANLLACLPPGEEILTTPDRRAVEAAHTLAPSHPTCFLAHEIGSGPWHAYLWGEAAARFFALPRTGHRIASCLHADEIDELYELLGSQGVSEGDVRSVGLVAFIVRVGGRRRVGSVFVPGRDGHRLRWRWDEASDSFEASGAPADALLERPERARELAQVIEKLVREDIRDFAEQRRRLAGVLRAARST